MQGGTRPGRQGEGASEMGVVQGEGASRIGVVQGEGASEMGVSQVEGASRAGKGAETFPRSPRTRPASAASPVLPPRGPAASRPREARS